MPEVTGMERSRWMELRRMEIQRLQYLVAIEQSDLEVEELTDRIERAHERKQQTQQQVAELERKIETAKKPAQEVNLG